MAGRIKHKWGGAERRRPERGRRARRLVLEPLESRRLLAVGGGGIIDSIFPVGDSDDHPFFVSAAELAAAGGEYVVSVSLTKSVGEFTPSGSLYYQPGSPSSADQIGGSVAAGNKAVYRLRDPGTYFVRVSDNNDQETGNYGVGLEGLNPPSADAQAITLGDTKTGTIVAGQLDEYTFTAAAGDVITLSLADTSASAAGYEPRAELYHSTSGDRIKLSSATTGGSTSEFSAGRKYISDPLTRGGLYVIQVFDSDYTETHANGYALALEGLSPPSTDAGWIAMGQTVSGVTEQGDVDTYRFTAVADSLVTVSLSDAVSGSATEVWAELYSPSGQKVDKLPSTPGDDEVLNGQQVVYRLPVTGTTANPYVIQVFDNNYTHVESYALGLEGLSPLSQDAQSIAVGQTRTGTIQAMGEVDTYYFTLTAAELAAASGAYPLDLAFDSDDTVDYRPRAMLFAKSGHPLVDLRPAQSKLMTLSEAGTYVIQVRDDDFTHTEQELLSRGKDPQYSLQLRDALSPRVQSVTASDTQLTDADAGGPMVVSVVFSESMDTAAIPVLAFTPAVATGPNATLTNPSAGVWTQTVSANDTWTVNYHVVDRNTNVNSVLIGVSGAKDLAANFQQVYTAQSEFAIDTSNPVAATLSPADEAQGVAWNADLVVTYSEPIQPGSGEVVLRKTTDGTLIEAIPVNSGRVTISGARATIDRQVTLAPDTRYYVEIAGGVFRDLAGNASAAIAGSTAWNFTTLSTSGLHPPFVARSLADLVFPLDSADRQVDLAGVFDDADLPAGDALTITYNDATDNTDRQLVSGQLDGQILRLSFSEGRAGRAELTVRATDKAGQTASETFAVRVVAPPHAQDDHVTTDEDLVVHIAVCDNDSDPDGTVNPNTVALVAGSGPTAGAVVLDNGVFRYTPAANYSGSDSFRYTVRDDDGFFSNEATVMIVIDPVADYHNAVVRGDVNNSGEVSPLDALTTINYINAIGFQLPPDPIPPARPQYFYDVNGDDAITPGDVLEIINILNDVARSGGEGEMSDAELMAQVLEAFAALPAWPGESLPPNAKLSPEPPAAASATDPSAAAGRDARPGATQSSRYLTAADTIASSQAWSDPTEAVIEELALDVLRAWKPR